MTRNHRVGLLLCALACTGGSSEAYIRFAVDGASYAVPHAQLMVVTRPDWDRTFFGLGPDVLEGGGGSNDTPSAVIQWRYAVEDVGDLAGQEIDLSDVDDDDLGPVIQFSMTDDVAAHADRESTVVVRFGSVADGYIDGTVEATGLVWVSMTQPGTRRVNISANFRARIGT